MVDYQPGDAVSDIDWKASARAGHPVIKRFQKETNLRLIIGLDAGRSMSTLAPSGETKSEVAVFLCEVLAFLARDRGDQVGLVAGDADRMVQIPARQGTEHLEALLRLAERQFGVDTPASDLGRVLQRVLTSATRRSLVVIITDEARPHPDHEIELRRLRTRHEIMVIAIADLKPTELTDTKGVVVDVDGGRLPDFVRRDKTIRAEAAVRVEERKRAVSAMLRRRGITSVVVNGSDHALDALIDLLGRQRRVRR